MRAYDLGCLAKLHEQAATANRAAGISGCLLYRDGYFMQLLEGQRERVWALYDRIRTDTRHSDCRLVLDSSVAVRTFRDWGMVVPDTTIAVPDCSINQSRHITFLDIAEDAYFCYDFITAYARG
ncbi:MAG: BLUF domain-containing protein [Methylomonas sp.]